MPNSSLSDLNIVVTRPAHQAQGLGDSIVAAGGHVCYFPLLTITPINDAPLQTQLAQLDQFQLAIFISPNAAQYGLAAIQQQRPLPNTLSIAAVGAGTQRTLQQLGIQNCLRPDNRFDSEGLLAMAELQNLSGQKVIIFRGDGGRELLGDTLKQRGATVEYACCYLRQKPTLSLATLQQAQADAITVTSSEALSYLSEMLACDTTLFNTPLFAPHPRIAQLAQQQGWQQVITTESGDAGLLQGLQQWANKRKEKP